MHRVARCLALVLAIGTGHAVWASEPQVVGWEDLLPEKQSFADPFAELDYEQLGDLSRLYRIEVVQADTADAAKKAEAVALRDKLEAQGLDPDWLFEQRKIVMQHRRKAATAANPDVLGRSVRVAGYLLPLEMVGEKAVEFLLVPTVGACIHTPTPPPNQVIHVRYDAGFAVEGLYQPVWVVGEMQGRQVISALNFVDGQADVEASYAIDALAVDLYQ